MSAPDTPRSAATRRGGHRHHLPPLGDAVREGAGSDPESDAYSMDYPPSPSGPDTLLAVEFAKTGPTFSGDRWKGHTDDFARRDQSLGF